MPWTPRYTLAQVRDAVENSTNVSQALRRLGLRPAGGNRLTLKRLIDHYGLSTEHFDPNVARFRALGQPRTPLEVILVENSSYHRGHLKSRLYEEGFKTRQCELCGQTESWRGRTMALILDHINGVPTDNRLENLQIVCPNCAATLDTHCGRKNRSDARPRTCLHCGGQFMPKYPKHRYCSQWCGSHSRGNRAPMPDRRKVPRPAHEQLLAEVSSSSYSAVGRKYGVSDNAVRKWLRWYEQGDSEPTVRAVERSSEPSGGKLAGTPFRS
jgi:hypothetical protein